MSWIKFDYTPLWKKDGSGLSYVPLLEVELVRGEKKFTSRGLVDSGAYMTLAHSDIARILGIDRNDCPKKPVTGISAETEGFVKEVDLYVRHFREKITIPVLFVDDLRTAVLLGHEGFFESYRVKFQADQSVLEVSRSPSKQYGKR